MDKDYLRMPFNHLIFLINTKESFEQCIWFAFMKEYGGETKEEFQENLQKEEYIVESIKRFHIKSSMILTRMIDQFIKDTHEEK